MTLPTIFFADIDPAQLRTPPIGSLSDAAELLGADAAAGIHRATIVVTDAGVSPELFAGQALVAVVREGPPAAEELNTASETGVLMVQASAEVSLAVQLRDILAGRLPEGALNSEQASRLRRMLPALPPETGGSTGPEPTRYGDWQHKGRVTDF